MPALACCVDAAIPPGYAFPGESSLPTPESFFGVSPVTSTSIFEESSSLWTTDLSTSLYKISGWGFPYFSVNSVGNVTVKPHGVDTLSHQEIDLMKVIKKVSEPKSSGGLGLRLPLIIRLPDVLRNRLQSLQSAFDVAIISQCYKSHYQGVYPVKCNQDRFIVEDIVEFGSSFRFGLEAGSKPELLLAMSCLCKGSDEAFLICNGYKDSEYISLALMGRKLNLNIVIVLEQEEELDLVISTSQKLGIRPVIGLRAKLRTKHSGHFGSTSGEKGKFGLTTLQILRVAKKLQKASMLDCLQLLHFHIGSQIPSTSLLADGVSEAAQVYCELVRFGAGMRVIDIGGGLGIDYDGTRSPNSEMSVGYGLNEYASTVVQAIRYACDSKFVRHPIICSESGRALVSHHSVLVFEATSSSPPQSPLTNLDVDLSQFVQGLTDESLANYRDLTAATVNGDYDTSLFYVDRLKERCVNQFKEGTLGLEHLAAIDILCDLIHKAIGSSEDVRTYHVNLSLFTSIPDFWAIGQMFPILPIHHLDKRPSMKGILSDLTCDSDGKIDKFIGGNTSLPLHEIKAIGGGGYYLGMFLAGAYQEALGGLHNLFGGPSVVRVTQCDGSQSFTVTHAVPGVSCADVLRALQHEPKVMFETLKRRVEDEMPSLTVAQAAVTDALATTFQSMPYLVSPTCSEKETYGFVVSSLNSVSDREDDDSEWAYCSS